MRHSGPGDREGAERRPVATSEKPIFGWLPCADLPDKTCDSGRSSVSASNCKNLHSESDPTTARTYDFDVKAHFRLPHKTSFGGGAVSQKWTFRP